MAATAKRRDTFQALPASDNRTRLCKARGLTLDLARYRDTWQQRGAAIILTLLIEGLLVWLFLSLSVSPTLTREGASRLISFALEPAAETAKASKSATKRAITKPEPRRATATPPKHPTPASPNKGFVEMTHEDMAAGDIGTLPAHPGAAVASAGGAGDSPKASGQAPNGQPLYRAEWYREPRPGELALYLPGARPYGSWAVIACRTIPDYHVDDCQALGESPIGSGLAKGLRQAAWQFRVRPPRVGNKPLVGAWVSIRFDFTREGGG